MTDQMKTGPRHAGPTREVPLVGYTPRHDAEVNPPVLRPANPNVVADGSNTYVWPVQSAATSPMQPPRPHIPHPNVVIEPTVADAEKAQRHLVQMAVVIAVVLVLAVVVAVAVTR